MLHSQLSYWDLDHFHHIQGDHRVKSKSPTQQSAPKTIKLHQLLNLNQTQLSKHQELEIQNNGRD